MALLGDQRLALFNRVFNNKACRLLRTAVQQSPREACTDLSDRDTPDQSHLTLGVALSHQHFHSSPGDESAGRENQWLTLSQRGTLPGPTVSPAWTVHSAEGPSAACGLCILG